MYFTIAVLFSGFSLLFYVPGFIDTAIGVLTFRQIISEVLCMFFGLIALAAFARSIELDPLWPWRPEFRRILAALLGPPRS